MTPPDDIEQAVRANLDVEAARVDAPAMLARVKAAGAEPTRRWWVRWAATAGVAAAVAAGLLFVFVTGGGPEPHPATAAELLLQAKETHSSPTDRCYHVFAEWNPAPLRLVKLEPFTRESRLWTRGDQFWIETADAMGRPVAWGQTRDGRVWVVPSRKMALVYDPAETGEPIARYCDLMSLRVVHTIGELLDDYELFRRDEGRPGEPILIEARLPPGRLNPLPRFANVSLELDPETKTVRKAVLTRRLNGEVVGTLTFTLVETATLADDQYDYTGHTDPDRKVLDGKGPPPKLPRPDPRAKFRDDVLRRLRGGK